MMAGADETAATFKLGPSSRYKHPRLLFLGMSWTPHITGLDRDATR
jgi:hypothetical protein